MEILHHIAFNDKTRPAFVEILMTNKVRHTSTPATDGRSSVVAFEISESDDLWPWFRDRLEGVVDIARTVFTNGEVLAAPWVRLIPTVEHGYPHPKKSWVHDKPNCRQLCRICGAAVQVAPFLVASELRFANTDFLSLVWPYTLMAKQTVMKELSGKGFRGFLPWDVIVAKSGGPSQFGQQVFVTTEIPPSLVPQDLRSIHCRECGRVKYEPHRIGPMTFDQDAVAAMEVDLAVTSEWFGSGGVAYHEFIISHRLAVHILGRQYLGVRLQPILLASATTQALLAPGVA